MSEDCLDGYVIGVDVGTGSVRAALVDTNGVVRRVSTQNIHIWAPQTNFYQQSSENIWDSCCAVIKKVKEAIPPELIKGIGFDATCSLVAVNTNGEPVSISLDGEPYQNVIMWMDHRAYKQAEFINSLNHPLLNYVGGKISLEMQVPKLLWLKENLKSQCWDVADRYFDLPDFLTWKATDCDSRSLCSVVCKWLYEVSPNGFKQWNEDFYTMVGLGELLQNNAHKIGSIVKAPGEPCGKGLTTEVAKQLGLLQGTPVGTSIIDAHAGGIGLIGCSAPGISETLTSRMTLICGTSTCHMVVNDEAVFVKGVWGPYYSAMIPNLWLSEAGQSASGRLVDHIIDSHPASAGIKQKLGSNTYIGEYLNELLKELSLRKGCQIDFLTKEIHVWPDFHGNRSPIADPSLKGMVSGLSLDNDEEHLALLYLATLQALAYGTKHIIEVLSEEGQKEIDCILACGGLSKNKLFVEMQANAVSKPVLIPNQVESVLLGSAVLAATAAHIYQDVPSAIKKMACTAEHIHPNVEVKKYHEMKYAVFKRMLNDQLSYRQIMSGMFR